MYEKVIRLNLFCMNFTDLENGQHQTCTAYRLVLILSLDSKTQLPIICVYNCSFIFDSLLFADLFLNILKLEKFNNQYRIAIECGQNIESQINSERAFIEFIIFLEDLILDTLFSKVIHKDFPFYLCNITITFGNKVNLTTKIQSV